jgi:hypothetical protein
MHGGIRSLLVLYKTHAFCILTSAPHAVVDCSPCTLLVCTLCLQQCSHAFLQPTCIRDMTYTTVLCSFHRRRTYTHHKYACVLCWLRHASSAVVLRCADDQQMPPAVQGARHEVSPLACHSPKALQSTHACWWSMHACCGQRMHHASRLAVKICMLVVNWRPQQAAA